jgi:hypothetical protein
MADLFNQQISATYSGLLKTSSSGVLSASLSQISDGRGNTSPLYLSTGSIQFYGAYSFPNADGSANQVLKTDGAGVLTWENDSLSNTLNFSGGTGTGSVTLDTQTLAFTGTANEIVTSASSQAITLSFPTAGVTLPNGSIATTQTASDNSTKVATTAYVDNQVSTAGTVTSVALSVPTGLTVTGSPITTSGTIAIGGTLGVANGGTGATTLTGILLGNGTSAISAVTDGTTSGQVLSTNGSGTYSFIDAATGDVSISGTPSTNEVAIWTNSNTIKGDAAFQFVTGIQNSIKLIRGTGAGNIKFYAADGTTLHGYIENQVSGNGLTIGQLDGVTSAAIDLDDSTITFKTNSNPHLTISSVGNLGIGLSPSTVWSTSYNALQIGLGGSIYAHKSAGSAMRMAANVVYEGTAPNYNDKYLTTSTATKYEQDAGNHIWSTAASGTINTAIPWSERMRIDGTTGNVGIGTSTIESYWSGYTVLKVGYNNSIFGNTADSVGSAFFISQNLYSDAGNYRYVGSGSDEGGLIDLRGGAFVFSNAPLGTAGNVASIVPRLTISSGGAATFSGAITSGDITTNGNNKGLYFNGTRNAILGNASTEEVSIATANVTRLTISSGGDVTIGSATFGANLGQLRITNAASSNPASLSLFGYDNVVDGGNFAKIDFSMQTTGTGGQPVADIKALAVGTGENAADLVFSTATGGTLSPRLTITSEGKVGIGTDSPNFYGLTFEKILTISSADATTDYAVIELAGGSAAGGGIQFGNQTVRQAGIFSLNGSDLGFYTNSTNSGPDLTEGMRITSGGVLQANYGISFPSPANTSDSAYYSGATTLNAYEEGTWTPVIKFGTTVNSAGNNSVKAVYTRIGRVVYIQCTMTSISLAGTGNLSIEGLPYTVGAATTFGHTQGNFRWGGIV